MTEYLVKLSWDSEAAVWIATSEDIPGLLLESGSLLLEVVRRRGICPNISLLTNATL
jgi:hypothetical protein